MKACGLAAALALCPYPALSGALSRPAQAEAVRLRRQAREDYDATRQARSALRKARPGTPEEEAAKQKVGQAKKKLKDDRLRLRDLRRRLEEGGADSR